MFVEQVGHELKSIRYRNNWSLKKAAQITGVDENTIKLCEDNPQNLELGLLFELLDKYHVDKDIFFRNVSEYILVNDGAIID